MADRDERERACVHCGHREGACSGSPASFGGDRAHLWDWFDRKMEEMHEELMRERERIFGPTFRDVSFSLFSISERIISNEFLATQLLHPHCFQVRGFLSPQRRMRMFDTMFPETGSFPHLASPQPKFAKDSRSGLLKLELDTGEATTPEDVEIRVLGREVSFSAKTEKRSEDGRDYSFR